METKTIYEKNAEFIQKLIAVLPEDDKNRKYFSDYAEGMKRANAEHYKNASHELFDTEEKFLALVSTNAVYQTIFACFEANVLTPELEKEWREEVPKIDDVQAEWDKVAEGLSAEQKEVSDRVQAFNAKEQKLGVFQAVATNRAESFEEAEAKSNAYAQAAGDIAG